MIVRNKASIAKSEYAKMKIYDKAGEWAQLENLVNPLLSTYHEEEVETLPTGN